MERLGQTVFALVVSTFGGCAAFAQSNDTGVTDKEIKVGNTMPYSGPVSAYGIVGRTQQAYFRMINEAGGVNGRQINFISYDDAYSPPKTVEQTRKLVESDDVFLLFSSLGTSTQRSVQKYLNAKRIPQMFITSGANKWNDPSGFPWSIGFQVSYRAEARAFAKYILKHNPQAKVAVFYANDDFGREYLAGLKDVFGESSQRLIVAEDTYETSEPTVDSHIARLKSSGADTLVNITTPKFTAQTIKKMHEIEWRPMHLIGDLSISIGAVLRPAGFDASEGILSATYLKDASDARWSNDEGMKKFMDFIEKYMPGANTADTNILFGYASAQTLVHVLEKCGNELTRENVMKQAANIKQFAPDTFYPGISITTSATDFAPVEQLQMIQFKGGRWEPVEGIVDARIAK
jgi:ABC-type branched-subunit amino acid transport system substrate-binding protein